jgi:hypothetical protein
VAAANAGLIGARDRALVLPGFAGAFRRSELIAVDVGGWALGKENRAGGSGRVSGLVPSRPSGFNLPEAWSGRTSQGLIHRLAFHNSPIDQAIAARYLL